MKFTVVTISFNQLQYLEEAITSVLTQDYPAIEYIVVDPGSTDGSRELIETYRGQLGHIVFEPDQGAADGLNKGFERAAGEIFGFLNSDDALLPGAIRAVQQTFDENPECDIVMGNGFIVNSQGKRIRHIRAAGFTLDRYFYGGATWLQQATFFRRTAFERAGGFNVNNRSCWDGELLVDMVRLGSKIRYLNYDLALFRIHGKSITGSKRHSELMKADSDRMFSLFHGRSWTALDTLRGYLIRIERILTHPGAVESAIRARMYRS
ncbi:MAG TPA: glycosyltransferase family 2 protein [Acidobacteriaceae bacterium]|nr:glycosyltransferase family 2 protein [Acidobacteriaceae bacterium]